MSIKKMLTFLFNRKNKKQKCNSCTKGYNGTNGNGYQPCACKKPAPPLPRKTKMLPWA